MGHMKIPDKIKELLTRNKNTLPILQGGGTIALVTAISVLSVHYLMGDTLSDYARDNPDAAYGVTTETIPGDDSTAGAQPDAAPGTDTVTEEVTGTDKSDETTGDEVPDTEATSDDATSAADESASDAEAVSDAPADESAGTEYNRSVMVHFYDPDVDRDGRYIYEAGFYYEPLSDEVRDYITGVSYPGTDDMVITYDDLRYVGLLYNDLNGLTQAGELICNTRIAQDLVEIFYELYTSDYRIDSIYLIDNYGGDDTASMCADNTSCFNYRPVDFSEHLSKHAYGMAIDINPFYNPYIVFGAGEGGTDYISPPGSEIYADRSASFPYKIDDSDLCYRLFKAHGFTWGGNWNSCKDYQHFQKTP